MAINWTPNQQQAIRMRGGSVLVSAAAGSGKTAVLVQRIIELITDTKHPMDADQLLVVTFTNAAAAEMSARVRKELERRIADDPGNAWLRRQALLLGRAQISTVHAFCVSLLRDHFNALDIPPDFVLADEVVAAQLRQQALSRTLDALYADKDSGITLLGDLFGKSRSDRDTERLIDKLYEFEANLAFPEQWEREVLEQMESGAPLAQTVMGAYLFQYARLTLEAARDMLSEAMELCADDAALEAAYMPALTDDFNVANQVLSRVENGEWDAARRALQGYQPLALKGAKGADETARNAAKDLRDRCKDILKNKLLKNCFLCTEQQYRDDMRHMRAPQRALFYAVSIYREALLALKLEKKTLEFSDLERFALQLLCGADGLPTQTAANTAQRFAHVLVDEYQDTNEVQDLIFRMVSQDEKNLFFVGDVKQSIYGFRRADPELFIARRDAYYTSETGLFPAKITLPHNFRSSRAVVDAVNHIFMPIMTRATGGTDYTAPGEALVAHTAAAAPDPAGLDIRLVLDTDDGAEARYIAQTIAAMLKDGYQVEDKGVLRRCTAGDFCILLRSAKERVKAYTQALAEAGVRHWTDGGDNLFAHSEIMGLLSLLRVIDNPCRDVDLAAVMLSPLFGFTPDDLARLRADGGRRQTLYALLLSGSEKERAFLETLKAFRARRNTLPVGAFIRHVADACNAEIALCAGERYTARRDNIRLLLEYADNYAAATGGSLASFLYVCESAAQGKAGISREFSPPGDAVCVTTVHKSKGLEWPVVFVANAEKRFNNMDSNDPAMLFDSKYGAGARVRAETADKTALYAHKTLPYAALAQAVREKTSGEEMRVLYVALTRAKQKVVVTAAVANPDKKQVMWRARSLRAMGYAVASAQSWIDWMGMAAVSRFPAIADVPFDTVYAADSLTFSVISEVPATDAGKRETQLPEADARRVEAYNRRMAFRYSRVALFDVPTKLAVTELAGEKGGAVLYRPSFARGGVSAVERGSALHVFMQCADYTAAAKSVSAELRRLVDNAYLSADAADSIDVSKLEAFFRSDLGKKAASGNVLREYAFIDAVDAATLRDVPPQVGEQKIMLQGIADCIILEDDGAILVDYKSDRVSDAQQLVARYRKQLELYKNALDKQLPVPVKSSVIYSFALGQAVEIEQEVKV